MAFDACMVHCIAHELNTQLKGAKVERVLQPQADEICLQLHQNRKTCTLLLNAGANQPRAYLTTEQKENPLVAPMFCMLLRKHLNGAKILQVAQKEFERILEITFEAYDDLGFLCKKYLILEIMGKYSNLMFCDADFTILAAYKTVDFTTSSKRQVLCGMTYELPPKQEKTPFLDATEADFYNAFPEEDLPQTAKNVLTKAFSGIATTTAQALCDAVADGKTATLWQMCCVFIASLQHHTAKPYLTQIDGKPKDFFCLVPTAKDGETVTELPSFCALLDHFYATASRLEHLAKRSTDIVKIVSLAKGRLERKLIAQAEEKRESEKMDEYKQAGDMITSQIYRLKIGMTEAILDCYDTDPPSQKTVQLQAKLTPAQNAQAYYKRYRKAKNAAAVLDGQMAKAKAECDYLDTVSDSVLHAETESDFAEIRAELAENGYGKMQQKSGKSAKTSPPRPMTFVTDGGFTVYCGKNNRQNDYVTTKLGGKEDYWFHVKNHAGSHAVLVTDGREVPDIDFTQAATIAATYSQASAASKVEVDYTRLRYVKKPSGAKAGFVIYTHNQTAYVAPDADLCARLRKK